MLQDFRFAARTLLRAPGFTFTSALTLALGIGATTLMFSIINAVIWRPLPLGQPERLVVIQSLNRQAGVGQIRATALDFADWRDRAASFEAMAAHVGTGFTFTGGGDPELVVGQLVTTDFFATLGVQPEVGRTFAPDEFTPATSDRIVLAHRLWIRRFGGDRTVIGRAVTVNGRPYTVVGVMPPSFDYPASSYQLWAPLPSPPRPEMPPANRASHYLQVVARLKPGVTIERARSEMETLAAALAKAYPDNDQNLSATVDPLQAYTVRNVRAPLYMLLAAVALVALIACGNVTNLLLARATSRSHEVAVRQALGAGRLRLARQFLAESLTLYAMGATGALALAAWGITGITAIAVERVPRLQQATIDTRVLLATMAVSLVAALVFGGAPVVQAAVAPPADALKSGGRLVGVTAGRQRLRSSVVVCELALAVVLLVVAGLTLRSLVRLAEVNPGFDPDGQLTFSVVMPAVRYEDSVRLSAFANRLASSLSSSSGVRHAGATTALPLSGQNLENAFDVEGFVPAANEVPVAGMRGIVGDYFRALGITLKAGRFFTDADRAGSQPVAIVNETFARKYWPGKNAVGQRLLEGGGVGAMRTVVGVIGDVRHAGPSEEVRPEVDLPYSQLEPSFMTTWARGLAFVVEGDAPGTGLLAVARARVSEADGSMPLVDPAPLSQLASEAIAEPRLRTALLGGFALLAVGLAALGVFGVLAYFVSQRTREIGIRVALGATRADVVRLIVVRGLSLSLAGLALGVAATIPLARWMRSFLFGVQPTDVVTIALVAAGLGCVALLASYIPVRRALRIEPAVALKLE